MSAAKPIAMNWMDRVAATLSPRWGWQRLAYRQALASAGYEGGRVSRLRKPMRDSRGPDQIVASASIQTRNYARHLERNHDLARGALRVMVRNIVGANGISVEPMPRDVSGKVHTDFADQILRLQKAWARRPEVTAAMDWPMAQRKACLSWLRDGEEFTQMIAGSVPGLRHGSPVPFSLELLEADMVPLDYEDIGLNIVQGIRCNTWGQKTGFFVYKQHPQQGYGLSMLGDLKEVGSERMLHLALTDRLHQRRGITLFAACINVLEDIKDIKEFELAAAKIAGALTAVITRTDMDAPSGGASRTSDVGRELMRLEAGMIYDGAQPGEGITIVDSKRPNTALESFIDFNVRNFAAGIDGSFSSISRNYNGTYSAQRQELVEVWESYRTLRGELVGQFNRPVYEQLVATAIAAGLLKVPSNIDPFSLFDAEFRGPAMPWIQPVQEANGELIKVRAGFKSLTQVVRENNGDPWETIDQLAEERRYAGQQGVRLLCDPANDRSASDTSPTGDEPPAAPTPRSSLNGFSGVH